MKKIVLSLFLGLVMVLPTLAQDAEGASIKFAVSEHDFGDVKQGEKVTHVFSFTNEGKAPLLISNIVTTCGCTAPSYPKEPIMSNETGEVTIVFNTQGKMGIQNKIITVYTNGTEPQVRIKIKANVVP
ncbi:DUF1573 domain-containing protein [Flammeovirgaceae bacterium SG7u.111]|nr:DUF1573 domain-containing protein [Flammeovirgaceae bacterium SG7u.132]WPO34745.1 DUF1573 domain-containing protein [Flammeovirgaceae bacterium SG7u.111]